MEAFPSEVTFGPYQLHAKIAEGGMAEVFLGTSKQVEYQGQFLAIKKLQTRLNSNKPFVNLLIHEAKIGVLLNHPGIASVYDLGSYKSEFFLTMEYVHGKSLDRILEKIQAGTGPKLSVEISTFIILEVLKALAFAHELRDSKGREMNIVHRDISPGNILLGYRGEVKLADFGIATAESRLQPGFSQNALGKLAYISPEQVVNDPVVRASDIYSLGVVFYQLLSGQLPFHAESANALYKKVIDGRITDLRMTGPTISPGLRDIVTQCLNRSPRKRYESAAQLYNVLIEHFKKEYELDFSTKAVRLYYKKKLSEHLRACFETEIVQEIDITQNALKRASDREDFKVTAPQDLKRMADFSAENVDLQAEATIVEADLTNESTRHFPFTENERSKMMKGATPKEVIEASHQEKIVTGSQKVAAGVEGFDFTTIPEYELAVEDSNMQRISVKDKLRISSLDKDQKETLKQQLPEIEIASEQDLEKFEIITFSGRQDAKDADPTHGMKRTDILRDFEKIKSEIDSSRKSNITSKTEKIPIGKISGPQHVTSSIKRTSHPTERIDRNSYLEFRIHRGTALVIIAAAIVGGTAVGVLHYFHLIP
ncbi:MAG: serine/threonine protein kinase [Deltaproteobacteria bacterium]|nr:serine/threonine protein kinase [Deltaproteobacteria bacterium]